MNGGFLCVASERSEGDGADELVEHTSYSDAQFLLINIIHTSLDTLGTIATHWKSSVVQHCLHLSRGQSQRILFRIPTP